MHLGVQYKEVQSMLQFPQDTEYLWGKTFYD